MLTRRGLLGAILTASTQRAVFPITLGFSAPVPVAAESKALPALTDKLKLACGQSDVVWKYIVSVMGAKKAIVNNSSGGRQGESIRHFLLYPDNSWVLIYDFFQPGRPSEEDQACIVAKGSEETAYESIKLLVTELPGEWIGERLRDVPQPLLDGTRVTY